MTAFKQDLPRRQEDLKAATPIKIVLPQVFPADFVPILQEHITKPYQLCNGHTQEAWRQLPEIPSAREINPYSSNSSDFTGTNLPENNVKGPWESKSAYISAQYQLLRHDAIYPLQDSIRSYKDKPEDGDSSSTSIYTHVFIIGYTFANTGAAARIEFSTERAGKRIRWSQSTRLQQGAIVALSPVHDKFNSICKVAVVAARPLAGLERNPPQIDIFWASPEDSEFDPTEEYIMIEAKSGYFEASRHMLVAMQKLMSENFPMGKHLIGLSKTMDPPSYVEQQPNMNLSALLPTRGPSTKDCDVSILQNVDILGQWPVVENSQLDASQMAAVRRMLGKKIAIVQGPPGTGKTFTSITALAIKLKNWKLGDPPILVSAQTNHATDQLLNLIEPFEPNFLRLGGRTSEDNETVQSRTLYRLRNQLPQGASGGFSNKKNAQDALHRISEEIIHDIQDMNDQGADEASVFRDLKLITEEQFESLNDDEWVDANAHVGGLLYSWLGPHQQLTPKRCPLNNNGFEDEEDDYEYETLNEAELEARKSKDDDEDVEALKGRYVEYRRNFIGKHNRRCTKLIIQKILSKTPNLWDIDEDDRGAIYQYLKDISTKEYLTKFRKHMADYSRGVSNLKIAKWQGDATFIRKTGIKLIGCTTTGLSKYRGLLACLKPHTLLIEEAAETLEGTILAAMFESLEQLILVGDHQQLQAHCNLSYLEKEPFNLCVSLFERLVNNGIEFTMLNKQRRMISDLRELLSPFYKGLQDHPSVLDRRIRQPIPGMGGRDSYFFHHNWLESRDDAQSRYNLEEANMVVAFFNYLVLNGIEAPRITVLTFYNGQRKRLLALLKRVPNLAMRGPFNVFTVDSYQGEENDVILLSLVRSNGDGAIGFLDNKNRAVVALSRARRGMYIFGNCVNLLRSHAESFEFWYSVMMTMKSQDRFDIDSGFPIVCSTHATESVIQYPHELETLSGGCGVECNGLLPCGHPCQFQCHPFAHEDVVCKEPCTRAMNCEASHICSMRCSDTCACPCDEAYDAVAVDRFSPPVPVPVATNVATQSIPTTFSFDPSLRPAVLPLQPELSDNIQVSNAPAWQEWDALSSDCEAGRSRKPSLVNAPVIRDVHRFVTVTSGTRQTGLSDATTFHDTLDHDALNQSVQIEPMRVLSGPAQLVQNGIKGYINPLIKPSALFPPWWSGPNQGTYAAAARQQPYLPSPLAPDPPYRITYSTKATKSRRTNSQFTCDSGQRARKTSRKNCSSPQLIEPIGDAAKALKGDNSKHIGSKQTYMPTTKNVSVSQTRLFVSGISVNDTNASFKRLFEAFGGVLDTEVMNDSTGYPKRFGFVTMASAEQANDAINGLNGNYLHGQVLTVERARLPPNPRNPVPKSAQKQSNSGSNNPQKQSNSGSKSPQKQSNSGSKSSQKQSNSASKTPQKQSNPGSKDFPKKLSPRMKQVPVVAILQQHTPKNFEDQRISQQTNRSSNGSANQVTANLALEQEVAQMQNEDLISFD